MFWGVYRSRVIYRQLFTSLGPILMVGPVDLVPVYGVTGTLTVSLNWFERLRNDRGGRQSVGSLLSAYT